MSIDQGGFDRSDFRQNWTMLLPCTIGIMLCSVHGYSFGVLIGPLEREFGWSRAELSTGPFIISMIALFAAPLVGIAVDRVGPRRIALFGVPFFCAMFALISTTTHDVTSWWMHWFLLGLAAMFVMPMIWTAAISSLFVRNRGMALAIALCGTSIGATFVPMLTNWLVEHHGWRGAYVGIALVNVTIALPLAWLFLRSAHDDRRTAGKSGGPRENAATLPGYTVRQGLRSGAFFKLALVAMVYSLSMNGFTTTMVPILIAQKIPAATAAAVVGLIGLGSLTGRLGGGYLLDRIDAKKVAAASVVAPMAAVAILLVFPGSIPMALVACLVVGLSVGTELDACAYLAARHFGLRSFGTLFGTLNGILLFANGIAPMLVNRVYDVTRSYEMFLWISLPCFFLSGLFFMTLGRYPDFGEPAVGPAH